MPVTYYPAQVLTVTTGALNTEVQIELVQSADVDFSVGRQDVFEFGNLYAVDNIQIEPATVTLNFSYALASGSAVNPVNAVRLGMGNFDTFLNDQGRTYGISGAGRLVITSGIISSYSVEGSVGNIPTVSVTVDATNAQYFPANPLFKGTAGFAGSETYARVIQPKDINVRIGVPPSYDQNAVTGLRTYEARSFTFTLDVPRNKINKLGTINPIANILAGPPKVTVDAEIILNGEDNPKFDPDTPQTVLIDCGDKDFSISSAKLSNFTVTNTLDDIQVASITLEAPVTGAQSLTLEGESAVAP
jgi:hypothetical protein